MKSAPGHDRTKNIALKNFHQAFPHVLPTLFTAMFRFSVYPDEWKLALCVVIPKPGKTRYDSAKSYRPISLLPCLSKIFDRVTALRLARAAARCGGISKTQMGARDKHSAIDALLRILTPMSSDLSVKRTTGRNPTRPSLLALDIEGAFNNTNPHKLIQIMKQRKMPRYLCEWTRAFTTERKLAFCFDEMTENPKPFDSGLPQGSPASPLLFLIYANAMLENPNTQNPKELDTSYVDDASYLQRSVNTMAAIRRLKERTAPQIEKGERIGLRFSPGKSELIHCLPKTSRDKTKDLSKHHTLTINGNDIPPSRSLKYLGIHIDESLTFLPHAQIAATKGRSSLGTLSHLRNGNKGISANTSHHLAMAYILPKMLWASPAWWTGSTSVLYTLSLSYHSIARWITGLPANTRTNKLLTCANLPPLAAYLDYLSGMFAVRLHFLPRDHALGPPKANTATKKDLPGLHVLHGYTKEIAIEPLEDRSVEGHGEIAETTALWQAAKKEHLSREHNEWLGSLPEGTVTLYTDGSKFEDENTGSGWVAFKNGPDGTRKIGEGSYHLGHRAEVYDAELHAVKSAILWTTNTLPTPHTVYIGIDNQAAIATLANNHNNHQYAREALSSADTASKAGWHFKTIWCRAHVGITGNELADTLAKKGAGGKLTCSDAVTTKAWMQATIKAKLRARWKEELPLSNASPSFHTPLKGLPWNHSRALFRVFCSRTPNDPHPNETPDECPCGTGTLTSKHLTTTCPSFDAPRTQLKSKIDGPLDIPNLTMNPRNMPATIRFLRLTGIGYRKVDPPTPTPPTTPPPSQPPETPRDSEPDTDDEFDYFATHMT
jgi:ribonuclease HI